MVIVFAFVLTICSILPVFYHVSSVDTETSQINNVSETTESESSFIVVEEAQKDKTNITDVISSVAESEESDDEIRSAQSISKSFYYYSSFSYNGTTHIVKLSEELQQFLYEKCQVYGVDYELILALIGCESGWDVNVVSDGQYYGLGMISVVALPQLSTELGTTDLSDPKQNIEAICFLLSEKLEENNNSIPAALMSYNKGQSGAEVYFEQGIYETGYTIKVLGFQEALKNTKLNSTQVVATESTSE